MACLEPRNTASCTTTPVSPSIIETPPLSPLQPSLNAPAPACLSGKPGVVPLQGFVQELFCRSHTSGTILQTALCYIEAVCQKLPEIASTPMAPVKESTLGESSQDSELAPPELLVPLPLLYPCRTFLAFPILLSDFLWDRCYSNQAWMKLSGYCIYRLSPVLTVSLRSSHSMPYKSSGYRS